MKTKFTLFVIFILCFSSVIHAKPADEVKTQFIANYGLFADAVNQLAQNSNQTSPNWENQATYFYSARIAFKRVETLMSYLDGEFVKDHINGAPLPHIERKAPNLVVIKPSGFQIMEEALMEENAEDFFELSKKLNHKTKEFQKYLSALHLSERMVYESMREGLIRIAALGITGFDSPSEINTIKESEIAMQTIKETVSFYKEYLNKNQLQDIASIFKKSETYFNSTEFLDFDRFGFIKEIVNPLYKMTLKHQQELHIETRDLIANAAFSINYDAVNIFDTDFLNYKYYSKYSQAGIETKRKDLGKLLFFDPILSGNNERACASCHLPEMAFTDGQKTSLAFDKMNHLERNSPSLMNSVYNTRFFWDARASSPEDQIEHVLFNTNELNTSYTDLINKLNTSKTYTDKFIEAYPESQNDRNKPISRYTIVASITAYLQSLRSFDSEFDREIKNENNISENTQISDGFNTFTGKGKCATCHFIPTFAGNVPPLYIDTETEVLAVPEFNIKQNAKLDPDLGRFANGRPKEKTDYNRNAFKTPTIRNISLTAPYMHNGIFTTLEEVVEFYNIGGGHGWGIAPENTTLGPDSLHLTEIEIKNLIIFMEALTDTAGFTTQPNSLPKSTMSTLNNRKIGGIY